MLVHTDITSNWHILATTSYRITSVLCTGTLWLDLKKYLSFFAHFVDIKMQYTFYFRKKCSCTCTFKKNISFFDNDRFTEEYWVLTWKFLFYQHGTKWLDLENIYKWNFSECTKLTPSLKRSIAFVLTNPELKFIFVIRFWPTAIHITATVTWFYSKFFLWPFQAFVMICTTVHIEANKIMSHKTSL